MYEISIYGEKKNETTGKIRRINAGTVKSKADSPVSAVDDLKAILGKLKKEQLEKIVEIRMSPVSENGDSVKINL